MDGFFKNMKERGFQYDGEILWEDIPDDQKSNLMTLKLKHSKKNKTTTIMTKYHAFQKKGVTIIGAMRLCNPNKLADEINGTALCLPDGFCNEINNFNRERLIKI